MVIGEGLVDRVIDISFIDFIEVQCRLDFSELIQFLGEIRSAINWILRNVIPLLVCSLSCGRKTCQFAIDYFEKCFQFLIIECSYDQFRLS